MMDERAMAIPLVVLKVRRRSPRFGLAHDLSRLLTFDAAEVSGSASDVFADVHPLFCRDLAALVDGGLHDVSLVHMVG